jgi:hypothetical protein
MTSQVQEPMDTEGQLYRSDFVYMKIKSLANVNNYGLGTYLYAVTIK